MGKFTNASFYCKINYQYVGCFIAISVTLQLQAMGS